MNKTIKNILLSPFNILYKINPVLEQKIMYRIKCRERLNLDNPITYNQKLNWLKINDRNELIPICADKYTARKYISDCGFEQYLPKLIWHGDNPENIPFDSLPEKCVIKVTSGSGNNILYDKKKNPNRQEIVVKLKSWLKEKYLMAYGEWHYSLIKPTVIIEEFLSDGEHIVPYDFKLFCFNGLPDENRVGCIAVDSGRYIDHCRNIYNKDFKFLPKVSFGFKRDRKAIVSRPKCYDEMCKVASILSKPFYHTRIDFYIIEDRFYIGEITFYNGAGYDMITPSKYNELMGSWIKLNIKN